MVGSEEAAAKLVERAARTNPSGRETRDSDYASLVQYLLSPQAEFVQGAGKSDVSNKLLPHILARGRLVS